MNCPRSNSRGNSRGNYSPGGRRQGGAALIVAMLIFALCTALIVSMKSDFTRLYQRGGNLFLAEQAYAYLRGAEELAGMALREDYDQDKSRDTPRDDLEEIWARPTTPYALSEGGWLVGSLEDLQGRFNLNSLAARTSGEAGAPRFTAAQAQFIRLLQALEEPLVSEQEAIMITQAVGDWLDDDSDPAPDGAEDDYYFGRNPAHRTPNRPMSSVSELRMVAHVTPEIYRALLPWVTVWPRSPAPLNIHTAPAMVLRSINADRDLSPLSAADGQSLVDYREDSGFSDVDDFLANAVFTGKQAEISETKTLLGQDSSYFLLQAEVEVADRNMRLYSVLERRRRVVTAVARASGSL